MGYRTNQRCGMVGRPGLRLDLRWNHCFVCHLILAIRANLTLFPQCIRGSRSCVESELGRFFSVGRDPLAKRKTCAWIEWRRALGVWALARVVPILLVVAMGSVTLSAIWIQPVSASVISWSATTNYPSGIVSQSCVVSSGFVYCIGGATTPGGIFTPTNAVYFASISSSGVGSWSASTSYPTTIFRHSCMVNSGFVYCIAGQSPTGATNATYYAALTSSGVGSWSASTAFPRAIYGQSCVVDSAFVYCIGGFNLSTGSDNAVYFAPLNSNGVGMWSATTNYPTTIQDQSCVASSGFAYCVGGTAVPCCLSNPNGVYSAPLSSSGVGLWSATTNYPTTIYGQSCVADSGSVYCIGGQTTTACNCATNAVYSAPFVSSGSVGGTLDPIDKLTLLAPFIIPALLIVGATTAGALFVRRAKHNSGNQ